MTETPRQRRKAKIQEAILDAAVQLIETQGFANTSLRDIAKRADYSPAGLYKHFAGKEAIIQAVRARYNQRFIDQLGTVPDELPPKQRLIESCLLYIRFNLENRAYLALVNNLVSERKSRQQPVPQNSPYLVFYKAVEAWVQDEALRLESGYGLEEITYALWAQVHGMATLRLNQLRDFEADFETANRRSIEIYLKGLQEWKRE